jgi:hypothetical protein
MAGFFTVCVRLKIVAIVMGERASCVMHLAVIDAVGVVAVAVPTIPAVVNSSFHIVVILISIVNI